jgi:hypothetical protein
VSNDWKRIKNNSHLKSNINSRIYDYWTIKDGIFNCISDQIEINIKFLMFPQIWEDENITYHSRKIKPQHQIGF